MNDSNNTQYALHADPGKPLRDAQAKIASLEKQIDSMRSMHDKEISILNVQMEVFITERNVYRSLVLKVMNLKD